MSRIRPFMGRKQIRDNMPFAGSQQALNAAFQSQMQDLVGGIMEFVDHMEDVSEDIIIEALEPTFGKSLTYCPKDGGDLRASGYLESRSYRGQAEVEIGYGRGGRPDYAIFVHEMPYAHAEPTRDKFLQSAIDEDYFSILNSLPGLCRQAAGL